MRSRPGRVAGVVAGAACTALVAACGGPARHTGAVPPTADPATAPTAATPSAAAPATTIVTTGAPASPDTVPPTRTATETAPSAPHYPVATATLPLVDTSRPTVSHGHQVAPTRTLTTLVWRPAAPGRWPLVVFAHGFQVGPAPYEAMLAAWASEGYVVAAPEFPLTDGDIAGADLDEADIDNQPADVRFVLDSIVAAGSPLAADVDPGRVVLAGHSDGAETVLAESTYAVPPGEPAAVGVLAMSVSPLPGVAHTANPPILVTQGDADTINQPSLGMQAYTAASSPRWYLDILGGEHLPPLEAGSRWLPAIEAATEAWLALVTGRGSETALMAAGDQPGLTSIQAG